MRRGVAGRADPTNSFSSSEPHSLGEVHDFSYRRPSPEQNLPKGAEGSVEGRQGGGEDLLVMQRKDSSRVEVILSQNCSFGRRSWSNPAGRLLPLQQSIKSPMHGPSPGRPTLHPVCELDALLLIKAGARERYCELWQNTSDSFLLKVAGDLRYGRWGCHCARTHTEIL